MSPSSRASSPSGQRAAPPLTIQAFASTAGTQKLFERAFADRRLRRSAALVHEGGLETAIRQFAAAPTPNLLIIEIIGKPDTLLSDLNRLAEVCDPETRLVLVGRRNEVALYRRLVEAGVSDYLVLPLPATELVDTVVKLFTHPAAPRLGRVIACLGARGGVGNSSLARLIAAAFAHQRRHEVVLVDLDLGFGTAALALDQEPPNSLADALYGTGLPDLNLVERIAHRVSPHLMLLAAPARLDRAHDLEPARVGQVIELAQQVAPLVILDLPHQWTAFVADVVRGADDVVVSASTDLVSLRNLRELGAALAGLRDPAPRGHLVLNRLGLPGHRHVLPRDLETAFGAPASARLRDQPRLFGRLERDGQPPAALPPRHAIFKALQPLVTALAKPAEPRAEDGAVPLRRAG